MFVELIITYINEENLLLYDHRVHAEWFEVSAGGIKVCWTNSVERRIGTDHTARKMSRECLIENVHIDQRQKALEEFRLLDKETVALVCTCFNISSKLENTGDLTIFHYINISIYENKYEEENCISVHLHSSAIFICMAEISDTLVLFRTVSQCVSHIFFLIKKLI